MSGFTHAWLALREPADLRARNAGIAGMLRDAFAGREHVAIADLGCGTGSSVRALAAHFPTSQSWHLFDNDSALLEAVPARLGDWADADVTAKYGSLALRASGRSLTVSLDTLDLSRDLDTALPPTLDLVNASALIDLVSDAWLDRLVAAVVRRRATLLTTLSYSGLDRWQPAHPADPEILAAFNAHQQRDKGFGPALGPRASEVLSRKLRSAGYEAVMAPSPWRLEAGRDAKLIAELADGVASAAIETGQVAKPLAEDWRRARRKAWTVEVAHIDLLGRLP